DSGYFRTITVGQSKAWSHAFGVRAKMADYQGLASQELVGISRAEKISEIEKEAANRVLAQRVDDAAAVAGALTNRGFIAIYDNANSAPFELDTRYILEERMAFDAAFRNEVLKAGTRIPLQDMALRNGLSFIAAQGTRGAAEAGKIADIDHVSLARSSQLFETEIIQRELEANASWAEYLGTGDEFYARLASFREQDASRIQSSIAREEGLRNVGLEDVSLFRRGLFYGNYYTFGRLGLGKAGEFRDLLRSAFEDNALVETYRNEIKALRLQIEKATDIDAASKVQKLRALDAQEKPLKKLSDGKVSLAQAFKFNYEQTANRILYGYSTGGLTRTMAMQFIDTELSNIDSRMNDANTTAAEWSLLDFRDKELRKLREKIAGKFEYDVTTIANTLTPALDAETVFGDAGRLTAARLFPHIPLQQWQDMKLKFVGYGSLKNAETGQTTSAQNKGTHIDVDVVQNTRFARDASGSIAITPNTTGIFNVGAGAHEFIHSGVAGTAIINSPEARPLRSLVFQLMRDDLRTKRAAGEEWFKDLTDSQIRRIASATSEAQLRYFALHRAGYDGLLKTLADIEEIEPMNLDLRLQEMNHNEILTQFLSARETARYLQNNAGTVPLDMNSPLSTYFVNLGASGGINLSSSNKGIIGSVAAMGDEELLRLAYNYVKGPHTYKTPVQMKIDDQAAYLHSEAMKLVKAEFNRNPKIYDREQKLVNLFDWALAEAARDAQAKGVIDDASKVKFIRSLSSVASGPNTAVSGWSEKGFGRYFRNGDEIKTKFVVKVGEDVTDGTHEAGHTFVALRENGRLQLREIKYIAEDEGKGRLSDEAAFKAQLEGLSKPQQRMYWLNYQGLKTALGGLIVGEKGHREFGTYEQLSQAVAEKIKGIDPNLSRFAYNQKIHEEEGSQELHGHEPGHFQASSSPLKGIIQVGDVITLNPFIAKPGKFGISEEIQIRITRDGYEILGQPRAPPIKPAPLYQYQQQLSGERPVSFVSALRKSLQESLETTNGFRKPSALKRLTNRLLGINNLDGREIAVVANNWEGHGGVNTYMHRWFRYLLENNRTTLHVIAVRNGEDFNGPTELTVGKGRVVFHLIDRDETQVRNLIAELKKTNNIQAVMTHSTWVDEAVWAFKGAKEERIPRIAIYHASDNPVVQKELEEVSGSMDRSWRNVDQVLKLATVTASVFKGGVETLRAAGYARPYYVGPLPDVSFLAPEESMQHADAYRKIEGVYDLTGKDVIFAPHSLVEGKGHLPLLMALKQLKEEGRHVAAVLSSGTYDPIYFSQLLQYAEDNNLQYRVISRLDDSEDMKFKVDESNAAGDDVDMVIIKSGLTQAQLPVFYQSVDIMALPTYAEAFPLSLVEAQIMGKPVVATHIGGIPDAVTDGVHGFTFESGNWDAQLQAQRLAGALDKTLSLSPKERIAMGQAGRLNIIENHHPSSLIKHHQEAVLDAIKIGGASSPLSASSSPLSLRAAAGSRLAKVFGVPLLLATLYFAAPYQSALTLDKIGLDAQARRIYTSELDKATQAGDIEYIKLLNGRLADNYITEALNAAKEYRDFDGAVTAAMPFIAEANTYLGKVGRPAVDSTLVLPSPTIKEVTSSIRTMEGLPMVIPMRQDQGYATSDEGWYSGVFRPLKNAVDAIYENYPAVSREQLSRYTFPKSMLPIQRQIFEEFGILVFANDGRAGREKGFIESKILPILTVIPKEHLAPVKFIVVTDKDGGKGVAFEDERAIIIRGADFNLFHEIGHHVWWRVLGNNELERFNQFHSLIRSEGKGFVSPYAHQMEQYQDEQFSEIYRMYTTSTRELLEAANSKENYRSQALKEQISLVASLFAGNMGGGLSNIITIYQDGKPITVRTPEIYYRGNPIPFEKLEEVVHSISPNQPVEQLKPAKVASASSPLSYSQPEILSRAIEAFTGAQVIKAPEAMGVVAVPEEQIDIQQIRIDPMVTRGPPKAISSSPLSEDRYTGTISFVGEKLAQDFYRSSALERIIRYDSFLDQSLFNIHGIVVSPEDISKVSIKEDGKGSQKHVYLVDVALNDGRTFEFATKLAINKAKDFDFAKDNTAIPEEPIKLARLSGKADVSIPKFGLAVKTSEFSAYSEEYIRGETAAHKSVTLDRDTVRKITASWMKVNVFINNLLTNQQVGIENRFRMMTVKDMASHNVMIPVEATRMPVVVDIGESIPRKPVALITELYRHYPNFEGVFLGIKDILGETKGTEFLKVAYQDLRNKYLTPDRMEWKLREALKPFVLTGEASSPLGNTQQRFMNYLDSLQGNYPVVSEPTSLTLERLSQTIQTINGKKVIVFDIDDTLIDRGKIKVIDFSSLIKTLHTTGDHLIGIVTDRVAMMQEPTISSFKTTPQYDELAQNLSSLGVAFDDFDFITLGALDAEMNWYRFVKGNRRGLSTSDSREELISLNPQERASFSKLAALAEVNEKLSDLYQTDSLFRNAGIVVFGDNLFFDHAVIIQQPLVSGQEKQINDMRSYLENRGALELFNGPVRASIVVPKAKEIDIGKVELSLVSGPDVKFHIPTNLEADIPEQAGAFTFDLAKGTLTALTKVSETLQQDRPATLQIALAPLRVKENVGASSPLSIETSAVDNKLGAVVVGVSAPAKPEDSQETKETQNTQPLGGVGPVLPMTSIPAPGVSGTTGGSSTSGSSAGSAQAGIGSSNSGIGSNTGIGSGAAILQIPINLNIHFGQYLIGALMSQIAQTGTGISHLTRGPTISMATGALRSAWSWIQTKAQEASNIFASVLAVVIPEPLYQERTSQTVPGKSISQVASYEGRFVSIAAASSPVNEPENTVIFFDGHSKAGKTSFSNALRDNKIPLDIPLETVLFINGDNFYSIYKHIKEGRVVASEQVTTSDRAIALLLTDIAYIRIHRLPLSLYIGRFLTKLFAVYADKKTVVWEASGIITDFKEALKLQPELNSMPWRIITLELTRTEAGTGSYKLSQQDLGNVPAVVVSSPVKSSNNNIKQLYGIITRNALISSSPAALGSAFGYVLAEEAAAGIHFERGPPAIATIAASSSATHLPIYTVRTLTVNYDNDRSVTQPQGLIPSVPARRSAISPWQEAFRHAGVAGDLGVAAIIVYVGLAGAPNLQGLTPLARAHNTTRGGVSWLRLTMASLNSTTLLSSQKTTPYLQQPERTVTATSGYSYSTKAQEISIHATEEQIPGKSLLAQTAISSSAVSRQPATTTSRSTRSTARTNNAFARAVGSSSPLEFVNKKLTIAAAIAASVFWVTIISTKLLGISTAEGLAKLLFNISLLLQYVSVGYLFWVLNPALNKLSEDAYPQNFRFSNFLGGMTFAMVTALEGMMSGKILNEFTVLFAVMMLNVGRLFEDAKENRVRVSRSKYFMPAGIGSVFTVLTYANSQILHDYLKPLKDSAIAQFVANQFNDFCAVPLFVLATPLFVHLVKLILDKNNADYGRTAVRLYGNTQRVIKTALFWATALTLICEVLGITSTPDWRDAVAYFVGAGLFTAVMKYGNRHKISSVKVTAQVKDSNKPSSGTSSPLIMSRRDFIKVISLTSLAGLLELSGCSLVTGPEEDLEVVLNVRQELLSSGLEAVVVDSYCGYWNGSRASQTSIAVNNNLAPVIIYGIAEGNLRYAVSARLSQGKWLRSEIDKR
ncbi:MAG: glycosyltransferase, partial [Candidatus Omnitrophica bacterium]|nr:glycosyltransferase [Candidatus Omnitrophota bacterium]